MSETTYDVIVPVTVRITVDDGPVGEMAMHPLDPRRMEGIYDLDSPQDMLDHLAYNAVSNGCEHASALDGWGDIDVLPDDAAGWPRWKQLSYLADHHPVRMQVIDVEASEWISPDPPTSVASQEPS